jgi:hypothetical protein
MVAGVYHRRVFLPVLTRAFANSTRRPPTIERRIVDFSDVAFMRRLPPVHPGEILRPVGKRASHIVVGRVGTPGQVRIKGEGSAARKADLSTVGMAANQNVKAGMGTGGGWFTVLTAKDEARIALSKHQPRQVSRRPARCAALSLWALCRGSAPLSLP